MPPCPPLGGLPPFGHVVARCFHQGRVVRGAEGYGAQAAEQPVDERVVARELAAAGALRSSMNSVSNTQSGY